jgi:hypothetical protein
MPAPSSAHAPTSQFSNSAVSMILSFDQKPAKPGNPMIAR